MKNFRIAFISLSFTLLIGILLNLPQIILAKGFTEEIQSYKKWIRVNPKPMYMISEVAMLCAAPSQVQIKKEKNNPHIDKFVTVYVNEIGKEAMISQKNPKFPKGSVVVKEKLSTEKSINPELLTVMIKRESGFNPASGDWEYAVLDGSGTKLQASGKLENCQSCHMSQQNQDFIFRKYLPEKLRKRLH